MNWQKIKTQLATWKAQLMANNPQATLKPQQALLIKARRFKTNYYAYVLGEITQAEQLVAQLELLQNQLTPCQLTLEHLCSELTAKLGKLHARFSQEPAISPQKQQRTKQQAAIAQHQQWQLQLHAKIKHIETQLAQAHSIQHIASLEALLIVTEQRLARCIEATNKLMHQPLFIREPL